MRIILIDKYKDLCYDLGVNKSDPQMNRKEVPMEVSTKQFRKRNAILNCLMNTDTHPSAEMVYQMLQETHPDISQATVYRNLALFKKQGLATGVATVDGVERFDGETHPHVHFICSACGARYPRWQGICSECGEAASISEVIESSAPSAGSKAAT